MFTDLLILFPSFSFKWGPLPMRLHQFFPSFLPAAMHGKGVPKMDVGNRRNAERLSCFAERGLLYTFCSSLTQSCSSQGDSLAGIAD